MADLYVRQGLVEEARHIYENILARDADNAEVRAKLDALAPRVNPRVARARTLAGQGVAERGGACLGTCWPVFWSAWRDRIAASLIGLDGIAVETISASQVPIDALGAEFGGFVKSIRHANTELDTGEVLQFALVTERYITFLSEVTSEYYILLVLQPDGNYGRARFELSKAKHLLRDELI